MREENDQRVPNKPLNFSVEEKKWKRTYEMLLNALRLKEKLLKKSFFTVSQNKERVLIDWKRLNIWILEKIQYLEI